MKWYDCIGYILGIVVSIVQIILTNNPDVRIWASISLLWVLIALRNNNDNDRNERNQHSIYLPIYLSEYPARL